MIPKVIYQTWKTQNLHPKVQKLRSKMLDVNKDYKLILYTDDQMHDFVNSNFEKEIAQSFNSIKNIVSKADFWRYLILYKNGGIYLDIDSLILKKLDYVIKKEDEAVITAELNKDCFVQWALIFNKNHPILESTINLLMDNMKNDRFKNDVLKFSVKPYWDSVNKFIKTNSNDFEWKDIKKSTNKLISSESTNARIFGVDYDNFIQFKHKYNHLLRNKNKGLKTQDHWTITQIQSEIY